MTKTEHTPTPWGADRNEDSWNLEPMVATLVADGIDMRQLDANAAFIVRAVNSHAALVETLENALAAWPQFDPQSPRYNEEVNGGDMVEWFYDLRQEALAALTLAKGA